MIPGIEISAGGESPCHILGYGIRHTDPAFQTQLKNFRRTTGLAVCVRWWKNLKPSAFPFPSSVCRKLPQATTLGRPHLADALVEKKIVRSRKEAFQKYLNHGGSAYIPGEAASSRDVVALVNARTRPQILAHPAYYCNEPYLKALVDEGLMGLEVYYPDVSRAQRERFLVLTEQFNLIATGGSDYHGPRTSRF